MKVRYNMREIPKKNYFYLLVLSIVTVVLTLAFFNVYNNYSVKKESFISKNLTSINSLDLKNLLTENSLLFVFVDDIYNNKDKKEQEELFDDLKAIDINKDFVFYDNRTEENRKYMQSNYNLNIKNKRMLLIFEDSKLIISKEIKNDLKNDVLKTIYKVDDIND